MRQQFSFSILVWAIAAFGNTVILDLPTTQLIGGVELHQAEPINGIESISVEPLDANSVRIRIVSTAGAPTVATSSHNAGLIVNVTPVRRQLQVSCRRCPPPSYPDSALREGIEGIPVIRVEFDAEGRVIGARIERSSGNAELDQAALEAVSNFEFDVQSSDGQGGSITIEIPFTIPNEPPIEDEQPIQE